MVTTFFYKEEKRIFLNESDLSTIICKQLCKADNPIVLKVKFDDYKFQKFHRFMQLFCVLSHQTTVSGYALLISLSRQPSHFLLCQHERKYIFAISCTSQNLSLSAIQSQGIPLVVLEYKYLSSSFIHQLEYFGSSGHLIWQEFKS